MKEFCTFVICIFTAVLVMCGSNVIPELYRDLIVYNTPVKNKRNDITKEGSRIRCSKYGEKINAAVANAYFECTANGNGFFYQYRECANSHHTFSETLQDCSANMGGGSIVLVIANRICSDDIKKTYLLPYPNKHKPNFYLVCLPNSVHVSKCKDREVFDPAIKLCSPIETVRVQIHGATTLATEYKTVKGNFGTTPITTPESAFTDALLERELESKTLNFQIPTYPETTKKPTSSAVNSFEETIDTISIEQISVSSKSTDLGIIVTNVPSENDSVDSTGTTISSTNPQFSTEEVTISNPSTSTIYRGVTDVVPKTSTLVASTIDKIQTGPYSETSVKTINENDPSLDVTYSSTDTTVTKFQTEAVSEQKKFAPTTTEQLESTITHTPLESQTQSTSGNLQQSTDFIDQPPTSAITEFKFQTTITAEQIDSVKATSLELIDLETIKDESTSSMPSRSSSTTLFATTTEITQVPNNRLRKSIPVDHLVGVRKNTPTTMELNLQNYY